MHKLNEHRHQSDQALWYKVSFFLLGCSLLSLFFGVAGIVEHKSPASMANMGTLANGFFSLFEYHLLIMTGALGSTFSVWLMDRH